MSELTPQQQQSLSLSRARAVASASQGAAPRGNPAGPLPPNTVPQQDPPDVLDNALKLLGIPHSNGAAKAAVGGAADTATFGFADEGAAAARSLLTGQPYDQTLAGYRANAAASQAAHPLAYGAGQVAGVIPSMAIPGAGIADGVGLLGNVARGVAAGGVMGGVYGAGSANGDMADRARSAGVGAVIGAGTGGAVPLAGRAIGAGVRNTVSAFSGVDTRAANLAGRAASNDGLTTHADVAQALDNLGPQAMPADLGPNLTRQAGALAATPGSGQAVVRDALMARSQGANARIQGDLNTTLGPAPVPSQVAATIRSNQQALGPQYQAALANAKAVDTTALAHDLESQYVNLRGDAQSAVGRVRQMLNVTGTKELDPNPATLLSTRQAIDGMLATNADPNTTRVLTMARQRVDQMLTAAVPGIKNVDAQYAELARQNDALGRGQQALDSGRTAPRPAELATEYGSASPGVQQAMSQGARAEIDRVIGTTGNDVTALQGVIKGDGSWNRDRLATLFGSDKADQIIGVLNREKTFADTTNIVTRNSETAARTSAQGEIAPPTSEGKAGVVRSLLNLRFGDAAAHVGDAISGGVTSARRSATNEELARLLTSQAGKGTANPAVMEIAAALARRQRAGSVDRGTNVALAPLARSVVPFINDARAQH